MTATIQGFHNWQVEQYRQYGVTQPFASINTFRDYFFSWLFRIQFPKLVPVRCPLCKTKPRIISCDGKRYHVRARHVR